MSSEVPRPRPSSTLVLLRQGQAGQVEALMLLRADRGDQNSLRWVFPGGLIDASDGQLRTQFQDLDDAVASARLGVVNGGLDYWTAALRETLEEAGLLLAHDAAGRPVDAAAHAQALQDWRGALHAVPRGQGGAAFAELCRAHGWRLQGDAVVPFAHWITPLGMPKRFDTRFFVAAAPAQAVSVDGIEIVEHRWVAVQDLAAEQGGIAIRGPTLAVARDLARHADVDAMLAWARGVGVVPAVHPRMATDARGQRQSIAPWHAAYAEVGRFDPKGRGNVRSFIRPGEVAELVAGRLLRITAPQPGGTSGPGINSYLLHADAQDWVLIDPGPDDAAHAQAITAALHERGGRLAAVLATQWPAGAPPAARFPPQRRPGNGERLDFGGGCVLRVVGPTDQAGTQLSFVHEGLWLLFCGDPLPAGSAHGDLAQPDGDRDAYLAGLRRLAQRAGAGFDAIAPGHGFLIEHPAEAPLQT